MRAGFLVLMFGLPSISLRADDAKPSQAVLHKFSPVDSVIDKAVHDATVTRDQDPIKFLVQDMGGIVGDLGAYHTDQPVQVKEQKVVGQLDEIIKALEQETKSGAGGSMNPMRPMADSKLGGGPGGIHELTDPKASEKQWGNLSPKQRDQILQSKTDGFPQGYEALLQSYYKRLASEQVSEEKAADGANPENAPTTAASGK